MKQITHTCCNEHAEDFFWAQQFWSPNHLKSMEAFQKYTFGGGWFSPLQVINSSFSFVRQDWSWACHRRGITDHSSFWLPPAAHVVYLGSLSHCPLNNSSSFSFIKTILKILPGIFPAVKWIFLCLCARRGGQESFFRDYFPHWPGGWEIPYVFTVCLYFQLFHKPKCEAIRAFTGTALPCFLSPLTDSFMCRRLLILGLDIHPYFT